MICRCDHARGLLPVLALAAACTAAVGEPGSAGQGGAKAREETAAASRSGGLVPVPDWASYARIGSYDPAGFPCWDRAEEPRREMARLFFKQPLYLEARESAFARVRVLPAGGPSCVVAAETVSQVHTTPVECPAAGKPVAVAPIERLVPGGKPDQWKGEGKGGAAGVFFPTFYQIAQERLYPPKPGEKTLVSLSDEKGERIAKVSAEFQRALLKQGTGALSDGRVLNVGRRTRHGRRWVVLPPGSFGLGIAGYNLYPYRSAAVDFDLLCHRIGGKEGCDPDNVEKKDPEVTKKNRTALVGSLLYLPRLAGVKMGDGSTHDGLVCAVDVGGGIKADRIDLFVGTDGAGNPYYPPCRRDNPWLAAGVQSLIPSDWHRWVQAPDGSWTREIETEYRDLAAHKGLEVFLVPGVKCARTAGKAR